MRNLFANKWRCLQAVLGIVMGTASVIVMLNIIPATFDVVEFVYKQYNSPDTMHFMVMTNINNTKRVGIEDMRQLAADNPEFIKAVSPHINSGLPVSLKGAAGEAAEYNVFGVDENYLGTMSSLRLAAGRFFKPMEIDREQRVCVVGYALNYNNNNEILGQTLRLWGADYKVIGVLDMGAADYNRCIMLPYTIMKRVQGEVTTPRYDLQGEFYVDSYYIKANGVENIANARLAATDMLAERLGQINRDWYYISASYRYFEEMSKIDVYQTMCTYLLFSVVALLVGGVGIMNVMLASVQARTKEIGIRKAFGATANDIKRQFMLEAVITGLIGGLLGVAVGFGIILGIFLTSHSPLTYITGTVWPMLAAFAITILVGLLSGTYPAKQAAKLEPVAAINES